LIYARSRRSTVIVAVLLLAAAAVLLSLDLTAAVELRSPLTAVPGGVLGVVALAFGVRAIRHLLSWPPGRIGFFRDRLVLIEGRSEMRAPWDRIEVVSLADQTEFGSAGWPEVRLTDRLTIRIRNERPLRFRPAAFGVDPVACRDLILRLRDDRSLRARLPEFDSALDLVSRPVHSGDLIVPRI
jgi:hypothetical protein